VSTAAAAFGAAEEPQNPNIVKVVRGVDGRALYFSRSLIPFDRDGRNLASARPLRHVGIYAYRVGFLHAYARLVPTPLEQSEQLEQLRVLEHGHAIAVAVVDASMLGAGGIDTPEQYEAFVKRRLSGST
jgi:3-deoxy-manno-octulosonate cytidylyltransferase (CMP-KDO synthetase)